jgi:hypothetical protein
MLSPAALVLARQKLLFSLLSVFRNSSHMGISLATPLTAELQGSGWSTGLLKPFAIVFRAPRRMKGFSYK